MEKTDFFQCFGRKRTAVAVAICKKGKGMIRLNGGPIELIQPELLRFKVFEPILLLGKERFANVDLRIRVRGGGYTSQLYAIRQAICKAIVAYNQKCLFFLFLIILFFVVVWDVCFLFVFVFCLFV